MFGFLKSKNTADKTDKEKTDFFSRLKHSLSKTRKQFTDGIANLFLGKKAIDAELFEELENILLSADVGLACTQDIIHYLTEQSTRQGLKDPKYLFSALKNYLIEILSPYSSPLIVETTKHRPFVIMLIGVNGAGKTTTIGKLAKQFQLEKHNVLLAAGDTFRAAAIEQLAAWGEKNQIPVIAQHSGADSASVIFDAFQAAKARNKDILLADTAGRLHTQQNLMTELAKVSRTLKKLDPEAPHETLLVLDATIGQNALIQASKFHEAMGVTGIIVTKLDGTAKGGMVFAIAQQLKLPIRYIGFGEKLDDLKPFVAESFVEALFDNIDEQMTHE